MISCFLFLLKPKIKRHVLGMSPVGMDWEHSLGMSPVVMRPGNLERRLRRGMIQLTQSGGIPSLVLHKADIC